nr:glycosyltransferase [Ureibacillus chungkukjangi]
MKDRLRRKNVVRITVIIPALNPLPSLIGFIKELISLEIESIIIVNDGSDGKYQAIFLELEKLEKCIVIEHDKNLGKGRALKTGFRYILRKLPKVQSVITVGAHGQHQLRDVEQLIHNAHLFSNGIILGVRNFHSNKVSLKTRLGNHATSLLFALLFHKRLLDTQTGLRCIPRKELHWLMKVPGESYSYDSNMLIDAIKRNIPIYEIPIGHMGLKKNSLIHYDEITNTQKLIEQMITIYTKRRKIHK